MRSRGQVLSAAAAIGAWGLLVPALQLPYIVAQSGVTPVGLNAALALGCGLVLGSLWLAGLLTWSRARLGWEAGAALNRLGLAHLPVLLAAAVLLLAGPAAQPRLSGWRLACVALGVAAGAAVLAAAAARRGSGVGGSWPGPWLFILRSTAWLVLVGVLAQPDLVGGFSFARAAVWALLVVGSLIGWGQVVVSVSLPGRAVDWGLRAALGLAWAVAVGGVLNLTWTASRPVVLAFLALGLSAWSGRLLAARGQLGATLRRLAARLREEPATLVVTIMVTVAVALQLAGSIAGTVDVGGSRPAFDLHDDQQAYMVFPRKLLETGSLGPEPFEARRMLSLGGQSFLQTLVLAGLPLRTLHLLDGGIALVILIGLLAGGLAARRAGPRLGALVMALALTLPHLEMRANTSSLLVGVVLALACFRLVSEDLLEEGRAGPNALLVALVAAALCCVKSTFIPLIGLFLALTYLLLLWRSERRRAVVWEAVLAAALLVALLSPWMVSLFQSSHTFLYPVAGRGFEGAQYYDGFANIRVDQDTGPVTYGQAIVKHWSWAAGLIVLLLLSRDGGRRCPALSLGVAALATIAFLVLLRDPNLTRALMRYTFPVATSGILGLAMHAAGQVRERDGRGRTSGLVALGVTGALVLAQAEPARYMYNQLQANVAVGLTGRGLVAEQRLVEYRNLERAIPDDGGLLTTLREPFLLRASAGRRLLMSLPGMAGLPPGLPLFDDPEATARHLTERGIRYLAWGGVADPGDLLQLTEQDIRERYPNSQMRWALLRYHQRYARVVDELGQRRLQLYRDRDKILLDLATPVLTLVPGDSGGRLRGFFGGGWTSGEAVAENLAWPLSGRGAYLALRTNGWHPWDLQRLAVRVAVNGEELESLGALEDGLLFRIGPQVEQVETLRLTSATVDTVQVGARRGGRPLGVDVKVIEVGESRDAVARPTATTLQEISGGFGPGDVTGLSGFHRSSAWTAGDGLFSHLAYRVPAGHDQLRVTVARAHPWGADRDRLGLRVMVNGIELEPAGSDGRTHAFRLYQGLEEITTVRLVSSTFVPAEHGINEDTRTLGIAVQRISTAAGG